MRKLRFRILKNFQIDNSDSVLLKKLAEAARFERFEAAFIYVFCLLLRLALVRFFLSRCPSPAQHTACDGVVYQYMIWYVME